MTVTAVAPRPDVEPGVRISNVIVGDRARKDYGDLASLMESISEHGLLQPIGVLPGNRLLFGGRRLEACRRLGWESISFTTPATRDDAAALLKAERDENTCRKDMTISELVSLGQQIEDLERPKAEARSGARTDLTSGSVDPEVAYGKTYDIVGKALGMSGATYKRARRVLAVANDETQPDAVRQVAREAAEQMDRTGAVLPAERKVSAALKEQEATAPPAPGAGLDKTCAGTAARVEKARDLADTGHSSSQIAHALGMSEASARKMFRREGIDIPADRVVGRARRLNANRVIEQTVRAVEPSTELLAAINYRDLDYALLGEWISSLSESLKALKTLMNTLEKELSRDTD